MDSEYTYDRAERIVWVNAEVMVIRGGRNIERGIKHPVRKREKIRKSPLHLLVVRPQAPRSPPGEHLSGTKVGRRCSKKTYLGTV